MIDLRTERLLTLAQAAALVPSRRGRTVSPSTVRHWCKVGCAGRVLEHVRRPSGDYLTTAEALGRFLGGVAEGKGPPAVAPPDAEYWQARLRARLG